MNDEPTRGRSPQEMQSAEAQRLEEEIQGSPPVRGAPPEGQPPPELQAAMQAAEAPQYQPPPVPSPEDMAAEPVSFEEMAADPTLGTEGSATFPTDAPTAVMEQGVPRETPSAQQLLEEAAALAAPPTSADEKAMQQLVGMPKTFSVSLIGWGEKCMLAAKMSRRNDPGGEAAQLGTAIHEVLAALDFKAQMEQREHIPEAEALVIADRVLRQVEDAQGPLSRDGFFALMGMVGTWAATNRFTWNALDTVQSEMPVRTELNGAILTGRIDRLEIEGTHARVRDYKTGGYLPSQEDMKKRTQTPIYLWHVRQHYPHVRTFEGIEEYLRYGARRTVFLNAYQVDRLTDYLIVAVERIKQAFLSEPEPTPGSHCSFCPSARECPLPETRRVEAIQFRPDAEAMAQELIVLDARRAEIMKALRAFLDKDAQGHIWVDDVRVGYEQKPKRELNKKRLAGVLPSEAGMDDFYEDKATVEFGKRKRKKGE